MGVFERPSDFFGVEILGKTVLQGHGERMSGRERRLWSVGRAYFVAGLPIIYFSFLLLMIIMIRLLIIINH